MKKILMLIIMVCLFSGCTDKSGATKALEQQGYKYITIDGYSFLGCSEDDLFRTEFFAKSSANVDVRGVVCSGIFKGTTIRTY